MAQEAKHAVVDYASEELERAIRTVVVDDTDVVLEAICALIQCDPRIEVVGRATNGVEALDAVSSLGPDLVIMDVNMPVMGGVQCAALLGQHFPMVKVVLMSGVDSPKIREQCRSTGADAFAYKINFREEFALAMRTMFQEQERCYTA